MIKKTTLLTLFALQACLLFSQDTTWYDAQMKKIKNTDNFKYYEILYRDKVDTSQAKELEFYKTGKIKSKTQYSNFTQKKQHGKYKKWDENGQLREVIDYNNGKIHGWVLTYYDNGNAKRIDSFENDEFIQGSCLKYLGGDTTFYEFMENAEFPGDLYEYLGKNIIYPKYEKNNGIEGKVVVEFIINRDGTISDIKINESGGENFDEAAINVIQSMPNWKAGRRDGEPVRLRYTLPIQFNLN